MFSFGLQVQRTGFHRAVQLSAQTVCSIRNKVQEANADEGQSDKTGTPEPICLSRVTQTAALCLGQQRQQSWEALGTTHLTGGSGNLEPRTVLTPVTWARTDVISPRSCAVRLSSLIPRVELSESISGSVAALCHPTLSFDPVWVDLTKLAAGTNNDDFLPRRFSCLLCNWMNQPRFSLEGLGRS